VLNIQIHANCHGVVGWPWLDARCPPKLLCCSPSSAGQGRENKSKGSWVEIRTGKDYTPITITGKTDLTWGRLI